MNIAVFGGCYPEKEYEKLVYEKIKENVKDKDINIISCGTIGTINSVCKATYENGLNNIAASLTKWKEYINEYVNETHFFENELDRLKFVTEKADAYILFDGDIGTFEELIVILFLAEDSDKPIYVIGEKANESIVLLVSKGYITEKVLERYKFIKFDEINQYIKKY